jgi:hypothetical protein
VLQQLADLIYFMWVRCTVEAVDDAFDDYTLHLYSSHDVLLLEVLNVKTAKELNDLISAEVMNCPKELLHEEWHLQRINHSALTLDLSLIISLRRFTLLSRESTFYSSILIN